MASSWAFKGLQEDYNDGGAHDWLVKFYNDRKYDIEYNKEIFILQKDQYEQGFMVFMRIEDNLPVFIIKDLYGIEMYQIRIFNELVNIGEAFNIVMCLIDELMIDILYKTNWYNSKGREYLKDIKLKCGNKKIIKIIYYDSGDLR